MRYPSIFFFLVSFYFWLHWALIAARGLSLIAVSGGYSSLRCTGFSLRWLFFLRSTGSRRTGLQQLWLEGSRAQAQQFRRPLGLVAPRHVVTSRNRDRTHVPCIGRRILNHCAIREVQGILIFILVLYLPDLDTTFVFLPQ